MTADDAVPNFHDKESETRYWKSRYYDLQDTLKETEASLHDFMDSSKELEKEMDREISAAQSKSKELQIKSEKLKGDVDEWKSKYQRALTDHNKMLAELNRELSTLRESHNIYKNQLRDLELNNDELENAERMVASSLGDMEARYNKAIERTAMLEEELVEKSRLEEENQRLKDELQEVNEELAVLRETRNIRSAVRTSTPAETSSSGGRRSVDDHQLSDLLARQRPSSRVGSIRPTSRNGIRPSSPAQRTALPTIHSSSKVRALGASRAAGHNRTDSRDTAKMDDSIINSPSSQALRARQSIGPTNFHSSMRAPRQSVTTATSTTRDRDALNSSSKSMIGDMFTRMRALEKRLADSRNGVITNDVQSAIPRPSSRLGSSIGHNTVNLTPRRSMDMRRDDAGTPSSIPVPLSKSTARRPTSRLSSAAGYDGSHIPSSLRSQTPTIENGATLDFLDQDPSKLRRRSNLSVAAATEAMATGSMSHSSRPRGSTLTIGGGLRHGDPLRKSANPGTGRPAPPVSFRPAMSVNRQRSSSTGSNS